MCILLEKSSKFFRLIAAPANCPKNKMDKIKHMPKAELHAHLNGSLSSATLRKLLVNSKNNFSPEKLAELEKLAVIDDNENRTLEECFSVFHVIHEVTNNAEAVFEAAVDVIKEFAEDGVRYLELRTTPRQIEGKLTYHDYISSVIKAIDVCKNEKIPVLVKLLISIDRSKGLEVAATIIDLAVEYYSKRPDVIIGVDVSGNMMTTDINDFFPLLEKARTNGLRLSIHTAEVHDDKETEAILRFRPDRIGHGTFIPPIRCNNPLLLQLVREHNTPFELCLTSNLKCKTVSSYADHHLGVMLKENLPFALCTDDKGVFGTTLSREYQIAAQAFNLSLCDIFSISFNAIDFAFASDEEKQQLKSAWKKWQMEFLPNN